MCVSINRIISYTKYPRSRKGKHPIIRTAYGIYKCIVMRSITYLCMFNLITVLCDISAFILLDTWQTHFSAAAELYLAKPRKGNWMQLYWGDLLPKFKYFNRNRTWQFRSTFLLNKIVMDDFHQSLNLGNRFPQYNWVQLTFRFYSSSTPW